MYKIIVRNTCIIVRGYTLGDCPKLEDSFKIWEMVTHSFKYLGMMYKEETKELYLPRGIDLWFIENCLGNPQVIYEVANTYKDMREMKMKYQPRDDIQKECLRFMLGLDEYETNKAASQLSVNLNTGKGKTYVSIYTMAFTRRKTIIIASVNSWLKQWHKCILEYSNYTEKNVHIINGSPAIQMLLMGKSRYNDCDIFLVNHSTLKSFGDTHGWDKIGELFEILGIGNMYIDEAHLNFDNICRLNYAVNVYRTYYITATPAKSDNRENMIYQLAFKNIPAIDLFDEDKDPHTKYFAIKYNSRPTPQEVSDCKNVYGLDRNKYVDYIVHKPNFYLMLHIILEMVMKFDKDEARFLFYIGTNDAILTIYQWISENYPEYLGEIGIYTSIVPNKKIERDKKLILSTTKSAGAAEDFKGLKITIVLAEPFKSEVLARQTLGRTRDDNTLYIELVDVGFHKIKQYYYSKLPVFNRYATETNSINLTQIELEERAYEITRKRERLVHNRALVLQENRFPLPSKPAVYFDNKWKKNALVFFDEQ